MEQKAQLLDRILTLKDYSPFILICDSLAQSAHYLLQELQLKKDPKREVVFLTDLNRSTNVATYIQQHIRPGVSVIGVFHTDKELAPVNDHKTYPPQNLALLEYMATSIVRIHPNEEALQRLADHPRTGIYDFSNRLFNQRVFRVSIEHRRKTGRSFTGTFEIDTLDHKTKFVSPIQEQQEEIPENLTTFNLALNEKQKKDRENVQLPFFGAQDTPDGGGAIVYQYEKDDDYDEEDPYEDPF